MQRKTLTQKLEEANFLLKAQQSTIAEKDKQLREAQISIRHLTQVANMMDRLIDGVCAGMKEANFPRRPHAQT